MRSTWDLARKAADEYTELDLLDRFFLAQIIENKYVDIYIGNIPDYTGDCDDCDDCGGGSCR